MKFTTSFVIAAILVAFASCKKDQLRLSEYYIPVNKCQSYAIDAKTLNMCLDSVIEDSRCPINAVCIWEGRAVARFKVSDQNTAYIITLATIKFTPYNKDTTLAGFKIALISISPQPELNKPLNYNDYVAEVKITKI